MTPVNAAFTTRAHRNRARLLSNKFATLNTAQSTPRTRPTRPCGRMKVVEPMPVDTRARLRTQRTRLRNKAALILFGRAAFTTMSVVSVAVGFFAGIEIGRGNFDAGNYAVGVGALFAVACAMLALMLMRRRSLLRRLSALQAEVDDLADRNWELREAEERARGLIEAQGDLIVRRDSAGRITYVNDAFCKLAGKGRPEPDRPAARPHGARAGRDRRARRRHPRA